MKTFLLLLLSSFASAAGTSLQTQDLGASNLTFTGTTNLGVFLSSRSFSAASSFSLGVTAPTNSTVNCIVLYLQNTSTADGLLTFNSDGGSHYSYANNVQTGAGADNQGSNSTTSIKIIGSTSNRPTAATYAGAIFSYLNSVAAQTTLSGTENFNNSGSFFTGFTGGTWANAALPTTMTLTASAGTMTGFARCSYIQY